MVRKVDAVEELPRGDEVVGLGVLGPEGHGRHSKPAFDHRPSERLPWWCRPPVRCDHEPGKLPKAVGGLSQTRRYL